jgi:4-diphosphocytidyl-2-C-methyl-D-erythritol kinase
MIEAFAPAKINLTLHVTGQRSDGYHLLDSLVVFADVGDRLIVTPAKKMSLRVSGIYSEGVPTDNSNLVWKAAAACGFTADIGLEKQLPNAAGIGGGSADAAAILRVAMQFGNSIDRDVASLGADVLVCVSSSPQRMQGIGDVLTNVPYLPDMWIVLVNPRVDVPTPMVFSALNTKINPKMVTVMPNWKDFTEFCAWLESQRNDLQAPAVAIQPVIDDALAALSDSAIARMSGSGATCFGLYPSAKDAGEAAQVIQKAHPHWWVADAKVFTA